MPVASRKFFDQIFDFSQISPLLEQRMVMNQMVMPMLLLSSIQRQAELGMQQVSQSMAEIAEKEVREDRLSRSEIKTSDSKTKLDSVETKSFALLYYNPELREVEVVEESINLSNSAYSGPEQQAVEEAAGQKSMLGPYSMIAQPTLRTKIDPYILESVLSQIEVENPKPFGGGAAVHVPNPTFTAVERKLQAEGITEEIVALGAIREVQSRKESLVREMGREIIVFEQTVKALQDTDRKAEKILEKLPPLSRVRYLALMRNKKELERTTIVDMLIADIEFLEAAKKKLKGMSLRRLSDVIRKFKGILGK